MMARTCPVRYLALIVVVASLASSSRVEATVDDTNMAPVFLAFGGIIAGTAGAVTFGIADLVFAAKRRWLPPGWAWPQAIFGGAGAAAGCALAVGMLAGGGSDSDKRFVGGMSIGVAVLSSWFLAHGILSLIKRRAPGSVPEGWRALSERAMLYVMPVASGRGTVAGLTWRM